MGKRTESLYTTSSPSRMHPSRTLHSPPSPSLRDSLIVLWYGSATSQKPGEYARTSEA